MNLPKLGEVVEIGDEMGKVQSVARIDPTNPRVEISVGENKFWAPADKLTLKGGDGERIESVTISPKFPSLGVITEISSAVRWSIDPSEIKAA